MKTSRIESEEVRKKIKMLKGNKAPGPDNSITELFKWLNGDNIDVLTELFNECWVNETVPEIFTEATIASLFKKGDTENLANYRPIALLNTVYKIYVAIIHKRISETIDAHITKTQYGFRKSRSTSHALYLARRIQDLAEQSGENIVLVLLDWEKAFDKNEKKDSLKPFTDSTSPKNM